jgi:uncharacterized protein (DUF983 family)
MSSDPLKPRRSVLRALLGQRCPRCREGRLFHGTIRMNDPCPVCGLRFEREPGYFLGAMYFSYFLAVGFLVAAYFTVSLLLPSWTSEAWAALAIVAFVPFVPIAFRYSRVLWIYYDRWAWPDDEAAERPR